MIQSTLEDCCLEFGRLWLPDVMETNNWVEPGSVELNRWTVVVSKSRTDIPDSAISKIPRQSWEETLFATNKIRHTAVHRLRTSAHGILALVRAAVDFVKMLNDSKRMACLEKLRKHLEMSIEEIVQNQNLLERKLSDELDEIAKKRAELDELERIAIEGMTQDDEKSRATVGEAMKQLIFDAEQSLHFGSHVDGNDFSGLDDSAVAAGTSVGNEVVCERIRMGEELPLTEDDSITNTGSTSEGPSPFPGPKEPHLVEEIPAAEEVPVAEEQLPPSGTDPPCTADLPVTDDKDRAICSIPTLGQCDAVNETPGLDGSLEALPNQIIHHIDANALDLVVTPIEKSTANASQELKAEYNVHLRILNGVEEHHSLQVLSENTRSAIVQRAESFIESNLPTVHDESFSRSWTSTLCSVLVDEMDVSLSAYNANDLTYLLRTLSRKGIPQFTVEVSYTDSWEFTI